MPDSLADYINISKLTKEVKELLQSNQAALLKMLQDKRLTSIQLIAIAKYIVANDKIFKQMLKEPDCSEMAFELLQEQKYRQYFQQYPEIFQQVVTTQASFEIFKRLVKPTPIRAEIIRDFFKNILLPQAIMQPSLEEKAVTMVAEHPKILETVLKPGGYQHLQQYLSNNKHSESITDFIKSIKGKNQPSIEANQLHDWQNLAQDYSPDNVARAATNLKSSTKNPVSR